MKPRKADADQRLDAEDAAPEAVGRLRPKSATPPPNSARIQTHSSSEPS